MLLLEKYFSIIRRIKAILLFFSLSILFVLTEIVVLYFSFSGAVRAGVGFAAILTFLMGLLGLALHVHQWEAKQSAAIKDSKALIRQILAREDVSSHARIKENGEIIVALEAILTMLRADGTLLKNDDFLDLLGHRFVEPNLARLNSGYLELSDQISKIIDTQTRSIGQVNRSIKSTNDQLDKLTNISQNNADSGQTLVAKMEQLSFNELRLINDFMRKIQSSEHIEVPSEDSE